MCQLKELAEWFSVRFSPITKVILSRRKPLLLCISSSPSHYSHTHNTSDSRCMGFFATPACSLCCQLGVPQFSLILTDPTTQTPQVKDPVSQGMPSLGLPVPQHFKGSPTRAHQNLGTFIKASSCRHDQSLTQFLKNEVGGWRFQASNHIWVFLVRSSHPESLP